MNTNPYIYKLKNLKREFSDAIDNLIDEYKSSIAHMQYHEYNNYVVDYNNMIFSVIGVPEDEIKNVIGFTQVCDRIEIVDSPSGEKLTDVDYNFFKEVYIDQWSTGTEGDSFSGYIYANYEKKKWLKIPFEC